MKSLLLTTAFVLLASLTMRASAISQEDTHKQWNTRTDLMFMNLAEEELEAYKELRAPNPGLDELNAKIIRMHELDERYLERDELDMLFIKDHLRRRSRRSAVVLYNDRVAALVWMNPKTGKAKYVSTFYGRNATRMRQIGGDLGYLVRPVRTRFMPVGQVRGLASTDNPLQNAANYAEKLMREEGPAPRKRKVGRTKTTKYRYMLVR